MRVKAGGSRQKTIARRAQAILMETKHHYELIVRSKPDGRAPHGPHSCCAIACY